MSPENCNALCLGYTLLMLCSIWKAGLSVSLAAALTAVPFVLLLLRIRLSVNFVYHIVFLLLPFLSLGELELLGMEVSVSMTLMLVLYAYMIGVLVHRKMYSMQEQQGRSVSSSDVRS